MHVHGGCVCGAKGNPGVMWVVVVVFNCLAFQGLGMLPGVSRAIESCKRSVRYK